MSKQSDRDRILNLLVETGGLSNARVKVELDLSDERYAVVRRSLLDEGFVEKYVCRGGGLRLTKQGEKAVVPVEETVSGVAQEKDLYDPLVERLLADEPDSIAFNAGALRKRGKWQNPDVAQVSVEVFPILQKRKVLLTSYEVKPWGAWDVGAVFEAASHARFAHEGYVVLEWPEKQFSLSDPRIDHIVRECTRFQVGLITMQPHYSSYRLHHRLEATFRDPADEDVEEWLSYAFNRRPETKKRFAELMAAARKQLDEPL